MRVPWTERRSNPSILKEISPEYSLEGLMLKLKLQSFGHLMRPDSFEKTLMLGKTEGSKQQSVYSCEQLPAEQGCGSRRNSESSWGPSGPPLRQGSQSSVFQKRPKNASSGAQPGLPTSPAVPAVGLGPLPTSLQGISAGAYAQGRGGLSEALRCINQCPAHTDAKN